MELHGNGYVPFIPPGATTDGHYNLQFTVQDGEWITVDGKPYQLEYLDETHFRAKGGGCFHICEFGQRVVDQGGIVAKMDTEPTTPQDKEQYHGQA